jgi:hypothetical protein
MVPSDAAAEVAVLPGMVEVVMSILASGVVAYPISAIIDMRRVGMSVFVAEVVMVFRRARHSMKWRRRVGWRCYGMARAAGVASAGMLSQCGYRCDESYS